MRLGLVERGNYKTFEYKDLTGYQLEVNGFTYNFGEIIEETKRRVYNLWGFECPPELIYSRLHFSEEKFFNRMLLNGHCGFFKPYTGAHVCLGLVSQEDTYNLVIHEVAHEIHHRQGLYQRCDVIVQEAVAIMAEDEFWNSDILGGPHYIAQQLLRQFKDLPAFGRLPFFKRWEILAQLRSAQEMSYLLNRYIDEAGGGLLREWLEPRVTNPEQARFFLNALAATTVQYALYNRCLLMERLSRLSTHNVPQVTRALGDLKRLDTANPKESLANLVEKAFRGID
jgi:hypothetical protein